MSPVFQCASIQIIVTSGTDELAIIDVRELVAEVVASSALEIHLKVIVASILSHLLKCFPRPFKGIQHSLCASRVEKLVPFDLNLLHHIPCLYRHTDTLLCCDGIFPTLKLSILQEHNNVLHSSLFILQSGALSHVA